MDNRTSEVDCFSIPDALTRKPMHHVLFGRLTNIFSLLAIAATFLLPEDGLQIDLCWIQKTLSLPCPGCGLTRSVTCVSHLAIAKSFTYHPFGILIYLLLMVNVLLLISPARLNRGMRNMVSQNERATRAVYSVAVFLFVAFGIARMTWCYFSKG